MTFASFSDMQGAVRPLRERDDHAAAIGLLERHVDAFPLHRGLVLLTLAEVLADAGRDGDVIGVLERALAIGCRYQRDWLTKDTNFARLVTHPAFEDLVRRADERYARDAALARPHLSIAAPDTASDAFGYPLLIALHGNNSDAAETAPRWMSATDLGWVVAVPQSSEIGVSPGAFTWNERDRTGSEVLAHLEKLKQLFQIDLSRVVLAGFSMGATQAIALAITKRVAARGVISVAAWLPHVREFAKIVESGDAPAMRAYVVVGEQDSSRAGAGELVDLLARYGMSAELDARPGLGHEYPDNMPATLRRALAFVGR